MDETTMSAYDLLPQEERDAIKWVREHGGIGAISARLMPGDTEWPRFDDGEPVRIGSYVQGKHGPALVESVRIYERSFTVYGSSNGRFEVAFISPCDGYRIKRPQVIAADGEPIEVGQIVYANGNKRGDGAAWKVVRIDFGSHHPISCARADGKLGAARDLKPGWVTHRPTILDADGVPIHEGDEVWLVEDGRKEYPYIESEPMMVTGFSDRESVYTLDQCDMANNKTNPWSIKPQHLTHIEPDSWERILKDAEKKACEYFGYGYKDCCSGSGCKSLRSPFDCGTEKTLDIVKRCERLAGVE